MIGHGNGDGVHVGILQNAAEVLHALGLALLLLGDRRDAFGDGPAVHVADIANLGVGQGQIARDVVHSAAVAADDGDHHLFIRALCGAQRDGAA